MKPEPDPDPDLSQIQKKYVPPTSQKQRFTLGEVIPDSSDLLEYLIMYLERRELRLKSERCLNEDVLA